jgi:DNA repair exonuclease SbcCD ATPase subunit
MADQSEERGAAADRLYALPLEEFTAARDELGRRLRREGDGDAAAEVKRLRKPSVAAWALNQVRRGNPGQSDELIEAGRRLREGQERLLAGGGSEPLQRAAADERQLVGELARHAERELVAAGRSVSGAVQEKLRATLHAVASDPEAREGLAAGRLVRDHEASGLGPLAEPRAPSTGAGKRKEPSARTAAALERRVRRLEERLERARARQSELDEESADAGRRLREARREAARAAAELERAEAAEERTRERAEEAAEAVVELERERRELGP